MYSAEQQRSVTGAQPAPGAASGSPSRVLIVAHNAEDRRAAMLVLQAEGYSIRTVVDADSALRMLETWTPALIVVELDLPDLDGIALAAMLRFRPHLRTIPVVAIASADSPHTGRLFRAVLSKPLHPRTLARQVGSILGESSFLLTFNTQQNPFPSMQPAMSGTPR